MQGGAQMGRIAPDRWEGRGERGEGRGGLPPYRPEKRGGGWYAGVMLP